MGAEAWLQGFVLVYSIIDGESFEAMDEFKDQIDKACAKIGVKVSSLSMHGLGVNSTLSGAHRLGWQQV